jgi:excisionase family DNA binding protein
MQQLLTAAQVAERLNVKEATIRKWAHIEFIPRVKLGGALRFDPQAIERWVEQKRLPGRADRIPHIPLN